MRLAAERSMAAFCAIAIAALCAFAALLQGCEPHDVLGTGWDFGGITSRVYQCDVGEADTVEFCWPDDAKSLEVSIVDEGFAATATCTPTPRHLGPCDYGCEKGHTGANAYNGCWCPDGEGVGVDGP